MARSRSRYHEFPDYRVHLEPDPRRVRVSFAGTVLADSCRTLVVRETNHEAVVYFPREDVRLEALVPTDLQTFCPFKGEASYWTIRVSERVEENAVWSYDAPFDEVSGLEAYMAFYPDRVEWEYPS